MQIYQSAIASMFIRMYDSHDVVHRFYCVFQAFLIAWAWFVALDAAASCLYGTSRESVSVLCPHFIGTSTENHLYAPLL